MRLNQEAGENTRPKKLRGINVGFPEPDNWATVSK